MTRLARLRVVVIGGSREAAELAKQCPDSHLIEPDNLPERFAAEMVIDGSHPCERRTQIDVDILCKNQKLPLLRLRRPAWIPTASDRWIEVENAEGARSALDPGWSRVFLCLGEKDRAAFANDPSRWYLVRTRNNQKGMSPLDDYEITAKNGPFAVEGERELMLRRGIDVLITRNAGGEGAAPKVYAARSLGLPVIMLKRPAALGTEVGSVQEALAWLAAF